MSVRVRIVDEAAGTTKVAIMPPGQYWVIATLPCDVDVDERPDGTVVATFTGYTGGPLRPADMSAEVAAMLADDFAVAAQLLEQFPAHLRGERRRRGLTEKQAAGQIGWTHQRWSRVEQGAAHPALPDLVRLLRWIASPTPAAEPATAEAGAEPARAGEVGGGG